jgi:single-strand DNA-binding protein
MSYNKVILMGNLTRDPESRALPSGANVVNFAVAVNRVWKDKEGNKKEDVSFIECDAFGYTADFIAKWFSKGKPILIDGRLRQDNWDDKETGKKRSQIKVVVESASFVGGKGDGGATKSADADAPEAEAASSEEVNLDDIPF